MVPAFSSSCYDLIERWKKLVEPDGWCELNVCPEVDMLTGDVIARTAFGSSYQEGKKLFELQKEQAVLVSEALNNIYIPGFRYNKLTIMFIYANLIPHQQSQANIIHGESFKT